MDAFATHDDLGGLLKRTFVGDDITWVTSLLEKAASYMRGVIGSQVYPATSSTYTTVAFGGWVDLPQNVIRSVDSVVDSAGSAVSYTRVQDSIQTNCSGPLTITFTYGVAAAPDDLVALNCVLVSQQLITLANNLGLSGGGLSSVSIDDFKLAFANAGEGTGYSLTEQNQQYLKDVYGRSGWTVEASR